MIRRTVKSILALLLVMCLFLSPLGTAAVKADALTEQNAPEAEEAAAEEESAEAEVPSEEPDAADAESILSDAQGESAPDEPSQSEMTVPEEENSTEESSASESMEDPAAEPEASDEPADEISPAEPVPAQEILPEEEPAAEESVPEQEEDAEAPEEEEVILPWENQEPYHYQGGLLSANSTVLKPKELIARKVYTLRSAIDKSYVLDVKSAGTANSTIIHLYKENGTDAQKFLLQENSDGTVTFVSYMSGKVIDIRANSSKNGAQVQIYQSNGTSAQKFKMVENSDGSVTLKHSANGKAIDVSGAIAANGRKVQLYTSNGTKAQKFYLDAETEYVYDYSDNDWLIRSRINSASVLDVASSSKSDAANIAIRATKRTNNQRFTIEPVGGYYKIINVNSGKAIDVKSARNANGTNVQQYTWNATGAQLWKIQVNSDGSVTFVSAVNNSKVLDVKGAGTADGTNVQIYNSNGTNAQKFFIVNADLDYSAVNTKNTGKKVSTSSENKIVLSKIIGAVESGGQNYESGLNYGAYAAPYKTTSIEYTITLGWAQHYGDDAKELLQMIRDKMNKKKANSFHADYDVTGQLEAMLKNGVDWKSYSTNQKAINTKYADGRNYGFDPSQHKITGSSKTLKDLICALIVTQEGKDAQDELFFEKISGHVDYCEKNYTTDVRAVMMYCEIAHLGGRSAANRIFNRVEGVYSVDSIMASLALDRLDRSSSNQVGDDKFWSRHEKCKEFVQKYAIP